MERLTDPVKQLAERVADEQDRYLLCDDGQLESVRRRLLATPGRSRRQRPPLLFAALLGVVLAGAVATAVVWFASPSPLAFQVAAAGARASGRVGAWISAAQGQQVAVEFSDGSWIKLSPGSRARVIELTDAGAGVVLESGRAQVAINPRREARWRLNLGPFVVQVTGTRFDVDWDPETEVLQLSMHEGKVIVSGCLFEEGRPVVAGEVLRAACREQRLEIRSGAAAGNTPASAPPAAPQPVVEPKPAAAAAVQVGAGPAPRTQNAAAAESAPAPDLQALLGAGRYKDAYAAASANGGFDAACERANAKDLMGLADGARFSGALAEAERAYSTLRRRFPGSDRAGVAAFNLARIAFDQRRSYSEAARWFQTYLRERPAGALAREALGRLMEAEQRAGEAGRAQRTAAEYLSRYPSGPHADLARRLAER